MIISNQFSVVKKFVFVSFLIFSSNVISSLLWYKNLVFDSVYINCFNISLFGFIILGSKTLIRALPDLKVMILLGSIGVKMILALLFLAFMFHNYNTTNKNGFILVYMANYFLYLAFSLKCITRGK